MATIAGRWNLSAEPLTGSCSILESRGISAKAGTELLVVVGDRPVEKARSSWERAEDPPFFGEQAVPWASALGAYE